MSLELNYPSEDEIEISLFGPGYGESIVLHLGDNDWFIVDSCIEPTSGVSIPLQYLQSIQVDVSKHVKGIFATHWHDDHFRGLSQLLEECKNAEFYCSSALTSKEFLTFLKAYSGPTMLKESGVKEFSRVLDILKNRKSVLRHAQTDRLIFSSHKVIDDNAFDVRLYSLSPSDEDINQAFLQVSNLLSNFEGTTRRAVSITPNVFSVVLWCDIGNDSLIFGGDMEDNSNDDMGWNAVLKSTVVQEKKASNYKVSHHGSITGDNERIWSEILFANPTCILTPFNHGRHTIPDKNDIDRICSRTDKSYITRISGKKTIHRSNVVAKEIKEITSDSLRVKPFSNGHIRCRKQIYDQVNSWNVKLFNSSKKLC